MFGSKTSASLLAFLAGRLRGHLPIFSRILLEKVGGTYLSLCNKNLDLNFQKILLENEVGGTYLSFLGFY